MRGPLRVLDSPRNPVGLSRFASQEFDWCLPWSLPTFVATMIMVKHNQIEGLLSDLAFRAIQRRSNERIDQFDQ